MKLQLLRNEGYIKRTRFERCVDNKICTVKKTLETMSFVAKQPYHDSAFTLKTSEKGRDLVFLDLSGNFLRRREE